MHELVYIYARRNGNTDTKEKLETGNVIEKLRETMSSIELLGIM